MLRPWNLFGWDRKSALGFPEDFLGHVPIGAFGPILGASAWEAGVLPDRPSLRCGSIHNSAHRR